MEIVVAKPTQEEWIPDLSDNLELPEDKQFKVIIKKVSKFRLGQRGYKFTPTGELDANGNPEVISEVNPIEYCALCSEFINPPMLNIDGKLHPMTVRDSMTIEDDNLATFAGQLFSKCVDMQRRAEADAKK